MQKNFAIALLGKKSASHTEVCDYCQYLIFNYSFFHRVKELSKSNQTRYERDVTEDKVVACFADEFDCPGGERKKAFVPKLKLDRDCKMEMTKYRNKPKVDTILAISFKFENFAANCQPVEALGKVEKLFHGIKQVKL